MAYTVILGDGGHATALSGIVTGVKLAKGVTVPEDASVVVGVGEHTHRREIFGEHEKRVRSVFAWGAVVPDSARYEAGCQIMSGVVLGEKVSLGKNVLVNTGAQIDHDCVIGDHCTISPGAIICGGVTLGERCFIGAGSIIVEGVTLDAGSWVNAGTLVCGQGDMRMPQRVVQNG